MTETPSPAEMMAARLQLGLAAADLARKAGVARASVIRWENVAPKNPATAPSYGKLVAYLRQELKGQEARAAPEPVNTSRRAPLLARLSTERPTGVRSSLGGRW